MNNKTTYVYIYKANRQQSLQTILNSPFINAFHNFSHSLWSDFAIGLIKRDLVLFKKKRTVRTKRAFGYPDRIIISIFLINEKRDDNDTAWASRTIREY